MRCRDELLRVEGISDVFISGQHDYSMRLWLDPEKLASRSLGAGDVVAAVREQNQQVACGRIGQQPTVPGQVTEVTLTTLGRLQTPAQFGDIILRSPPDGRITRLRDVARVEIAAKNDDVSARLDGLPSVGLIIFQLPDANALEMADRIHDKMEELAKDFPADMEYHIEYDTTPYTRECIHEVFKALGLATVLVALVVLVFLQNWRSAVIPLLAVPVAIIGTFGVMAVMHFSLNNLTLFGLVLAIGIVVDNAIVVVEAVEHHIEQGLAPREATIKAMSQLSAPVIAVGLVLSAVFIPCAFISGITGQFFRQFALTIASSTIISTFNSLTLSPALTAVLLRERDHETHEALPRVVYPLAGGWIGYAWLTPTLASGLEWLAWKAARAGMLPARLAGPLSPAAWWTAAALMIGGSAVAGWLLAGPLNAVLRRAFAGFNAGVQRSTTAYTRAVGGLIRVSAVVLLVYAGLLDATYMRLQRHAQGVHSAAGHGLPDGERAVARRRLLRADAARHRGNAADLPEHAGGEAHRGRGRHVVCPPGERLELRLDVRDPRRFRQSPHAGAVRRPDHGHAAGAVVCRGDRGPGQRLSLGADPRGGPHRRIQGDGGRPRRLRPAGTPAAGRPAGRAGREGEESLFRCRLEGRGREEAADRQIPP